MGFQLTRGLVYLDLITVDSNYRDKGIGTQLIESFREELNEREIKEFFLIAPNKNQRTLNFYRSRGFKEGDTYTLFCEDLINKNS